jgi:hypothetical protein
MPNSSIPLSQNPDVMVHSIPPSQFRSSSSSFSCDLLLNILLVIRLLSSRMSCPAHFSLLIFTYLTKSGSSEARMYNIIQNYISFPSALYLAQLKKCSWGSFSQTVLVLSHLPL